MHIYLLNAKYVLKYLFWVKDFVQRFANLDIIFYRLKNMSLFIMDPPLSILNWMVFQKWSTSYEESHPNCNLVKIITIIFFQNHAAPKHTFHFILIHILKIILKIIICSLYSCWCRINTWCQMFSAAVCRSNNSKLKYQQVLAWRLYSTDH